MSSVVSRLQAQYYTEQEAAKALGVSRMTVWRWLHRGKIQGHRIWGIVLIEKAEVEKLRR